MELFGGLGGDMGFSKQAAPIAWDVIPACPDEAHCEYVGHIALETRGLYKEASRQPYLETPAAIVGFTLVRSFGQGRWVQMMPMLPTEETQRDGTLARPGPADGSIVSMGMFPAARAQPSRYPNEGVLDWVSIVEKARRDLGDPSDPIPTVTAQVDISLNRCRGYWMVAIHDAHGNLPLALRAKERSAIHERVDLPDGREWTLTSEGEEGIFEFTEGPEGGGLHVGSFTTNGEDLSITADLTCGLGPSGSMAVEATTLPPVTLPPTDTTSGATAAGSAPGINDAAVAAWLLLSLVVVSALGLRRRRHLATPNSRDS
jgi:hypothetical protein